MDREDGIFFDRRFEKAQSIFPSSHHNGNDKSANPESHEQNKCSKTHCPVGG